MYVNGREVPSEGMSLNTADSKTCTMDFQALFSGLGIHHGNTGIQMTTSQFMKESFTLIFDHHPSQMAAIRMVTTVSPTTVKSSSNSNSTRLSPKQ
jgi:uncharacterized membrane protein